MSKQRKNHKHKAFVAHKLSEKLHDVMMRTFCRELHWAQSQDAVNEGKLQSILLFFLQWSDVINCEYTEFLDPNLKELEKNPSDRSAETDVSLVNNPKYASCKLKERFLPFAGGNKVLWLALPELWPKSHRPPVGCKYLDELKVLQTDTWRKALRQLSWKLAESTITSMCKNINVCWMSGLVVV